MDIKVVKQRFLGNGNLVFITIASGGANSNVRRFKRRDDNQLYFEKTMSEGNLKYINRENLILQTIQTFHPTSKAVKLQGFQNPNTNNEGTVTTQSAGLDLVTWNYAPTLINNQEYNNIFLHPLLFLKFLRGTISALYTIHKIGIVHCDLKVDQICIPYRQIARNNKSITVAIDFDDIRIIDFGVSLWEWRVPLNGVSIGIFTNRTDTNEYLSNSFLENVKYYNATLNSNHLNNINYSVDLYSLGYLLKMNIYTIYDKTTKKPYEHTWNDLSNKLDGLADSLLGYENALLQNPNNLLPHQAYIDDIDCWINEVSRDIPNYTNEQVLLLKNYNIPWNKIIGAIAIVFLLLVVIFKDDIKELFAAEVNNTIEVNKTDEVNLTRAKQLYKEADQLFNENKRIEAIELFKQSSELGNLDAKYSLASEYLIGEFIKEDEEAGIRLLKEAALSGHKPSIDLLKKLNISY